MKHKAHGGQHILSRHQPTPQSPIQYCRSGGLPELVQALARHYSPLYGRELDANTEITVSVGVSEVHSLVCWLSMVVE